MANLEGKHRLMRDYLYRVWVSVDEALELTHAASPLRREREQVRNRQAVRFAKVHPLPDKSLEQLHLVHDTLESAHEALIQAMALTVIAGLVEPHLGLSYVPAVALQMRTPLDLTKATLLELAKAGKIELRPDSGTARFSRSDLAMAPETQDGTCLLWTKLLTKVPGL